MTELTIEELHNFIKSRKEPDKQFYLDLLDGEKQRAYEEAHVRAVMTLLKSVYINKLKLKIAENRAEVKRGGAFWNYCKAGTNMIYWPERTVAADRPGGSPRTGKGGEHHERRLEDTAGAVPGTERRG